MPIDPEILSLLRCPVTKQSLHRLSPDKIEKINAEIEAGNAVYVDGSTIATPVSAALQTRNGRTIYRIDDGIPVMLESRGIPTEQFKSF